MLLNSWDTDDFQFFTYIKSSSVIFFFLSFLLFWSLMHSRFVSLFYYMFVDRKGVKCTREIHAHRNYVLWVFDWIFNSILLPSYLYLLCYMWSLFSTWWRFINVLSYTYDLKCLCKYYSLVILVHSFAVKCGWRFLFYFKQFKDMFMFEVIRRFIHLLYGLQTYYICFNPLMMLINWLY